ncbi:MAG: beta-propeller fold lactonase family protein, partial [Planctomycetota bacterium]|nr:beta-propeller fold lactonase family protein [Planctomycetota bacterium]
DSWSIAPSLPQGLTLDGLSGMLAGTPTVSIPELPFVVTAVGPGGSTQITLTFRVHNAPRFLYSTGPQDTELSAYAVGAADNNLEFGPIQETGALTPGPEQIIFHPGNNFAFVPNRGLPGLAGSVSSYSITSSSGRISHLGEVPSGEGPRQLTLNADGSTALVVTHEDNRLYSYAVDASTGQLTYLSDTLTNTGPTQTAVAPLGRFAYVLHDQSADITIHPIDPVTGAAGPMTQAINYWVTPPSDIVINGAGTIAYIAFAGDNSLQSFQIDPTDGSLSPHAVVTLPDGPRSVALSPYDDFLYVACEGADVLETLELDLATGHVIQSSSTPTDDAPIRVTLDETGLFAFVLHSGAHTIRTFTVDPTSHVVSAGATVRARPLATNISVYQGEAPAQPQTEFLYVLGGSTEDLSGFKFDATTGQLAPISIDTLAGTDPMDLVVDPLGRFVFVAHQLSAELSVFQISPGSGSLSESLPRTALSEPPASLGIDAGGRHLFVTLPQSAQVLAYSIHPSTGELDFVSAAATGSGPGAVNSDPTGHFVYVSNAGGSTDTLSSYRFEEGQFTSGPQFISAPGRPGPVRFSPSGEHLYVALAGSNLIVPYLIHPVSGSLTLEASGSAPAKGNPEVFDPHRNGAYGFSAASTSNGGVGEIKRYSIDNAGALAFVEATASGIGPVTLRGGSSGDYLFVLNGTSDDLDVFGIDAPTGNLTRLGTYAVGMDPTALGLSKRW